MMTFDDQDDARSVFGAGGGLKASAIIKSIKARL
jgi:hypothetical protein